MCHHESSTISRAAVLASLSAGAARQPLFSVILSLSIYLCLSADFRRWIALYTAAGIVFKLAKCCIHAVPYTGSLRTWKVEVKGQNLEVSVSYMQQIHYSSKRLATHASDLMSMLISRKQPNDTVKTQEILAPGEKNNVDSGRKTVYQSINQFIYLTRKQQNDKLKEQEQSLRINWTQREVSIH